ncbi:MAG TPA: erythromycin esterase family protein [Solirubrobacteraceae bacterium]|nr:erythromycin esterase family protein [Solirubrobacteraceae bacterium]
MEPFRDRAHAGQVLAERLREYAGRDDVVVLGLPRGGVPVAYEIAKALDAPLDVYLVRKLGVPGHEETALGAIATGGIRVLNTQLIESLGLPPEWIEAIDAKERRELHRRERVYRGDRPPPDIAGRTVILVDDGLATGSTMLAALNAVRADDPARVVVAVPVAAPEVCEALRGVADEVVCALTPQQLQAVGIWYDDFSQTTDDEVRALLEHARPAPPVRAPESLRPLRGEASDYDRLVERAAQARFALIGEASHGTEEFYRERAEITKRLIDEAGFTAVAVEADWPDAYRVNRFVRGMGDDESAEEALEDFRRFPVWMWRNVEVAAFATHLREFNDALPVGRPKVGFYGLDLYSLHTSMEAVVAYLDEVDPEAAQRARERYACFDQFGRDPQVYAYEAGIAGALPCEEQAVQQLLELRETRARRASGDGAIDLDEHFFAEQNAQLVVNAEEYYRSMFRGGVESWNLRDRHMAETLDALAAHLERTGGGAGAAKVVVWAHNSHLGDERATELAQAGQLNLGQLVRERYGDAALLVGFTTYEGTVTAASDWGGPAERKRVRRALPGSWEELFHERDLDRFWLEPRDLRGRRLERAIGVVYRPETERISHYFHARLAVQFDAVVHIDETHALERLERASEWEAGELPETYPWGV